MYINQARMASGAIYDNVDSDAGTYHLSYCYYIFIMFLFSEGIDDNEEVLVPYA